MQVMNISEDNITELVRLIKNSPEQDAINLIKLLFQSIETKITDEINKIIP